MQFPSKPNNSKTTAIFNNDDDNEVKEYINIYQSGDAKECLVLIYKHLTNAINGSKKLTIFFRGDRDYSKIN